MMCQFGIHCRAGHFEGTTSLKKRNMLISKVVETHFVQKIKNKNLKQKIMKKKFNSSKQILPLTLSLYCPLTQVGYDAACRDENESKGEEEQAESQRDLLDESNVTHLLGCLL